jgi:hypothetical protein
LRYPIDFLDFAWYNDKKIKNTKRETKIKIQMGVYAAQAAKMYEIDA